MPIETLVILANRLDENDRPDLANTVDSIILSLAQGISGNIGAEDLAKIKPDIINALKESVTFDLSVETNSDGQGNSVKAIPKIHDKWTDGLNLGDLSESPGLENFLTDNQSNVGQEETQTQPKVEIDDALSGALDALEKDQILPGQEKPKMARNKTQESSMHKTEAEVRALLVKMADNFDQTNQPNIASKIDHTLKSLSARPKAPLKKLDDDIKKSLIVFVHDADRNNAKSIKGLKELFRRLRYFDFSDASKDLGLDKVVKEMEKTQGCLDGAKKRFYELMHGRKPSKKDMEELFANLAEELEEQPALDFFDEQLKKETAPEQDDTDTEDEDPDVLEELDEESDEDEEIVDELEKELEEFLATLDDEIEGGEEE